MATDLGNQSTTAASNTSVGGVSIAENTAMSNLNDGERAIIAQAKGALLAVTSAGTNTITATYAPAPDAYVSGWLYPFKAGGTNTGAASFNANGLGAKSLTVVVSAGTQALAGGEIVTGGFYILQYDGINLVLLNPTPQEGSWTPVVAGAGTAGTQTYATQVGRYIREGNLVIFWGRVTMSAKDAATAGNTLITGLPFTASSVASNNPAITFGQWGNVTLTASYTHLSGVVTQNTTQILVQQNGSAQPTANLAAGTALAATSDFGFSGSYRIN